MYVLPYIESNVLDTKCVRKIILLFPRMYRSNGTLSPKCLILLHFTSVNDNIDTLLKHGHMNADYNRLQGCYAFIPIIITDFPPGQSMDVDYIQRLFPEALGWSLFIRKG